MPFKKGGQHGQIVRQNIAHFTNQLMTEPDPTKRKLLQKLLAEEMVKQAANTNVTRQKVASGQSVAAQHQVDLRPIHWRNGLSDDNAGDVRHVRTWSGYAFASVHASRGHSGKCPRTGRRPSQRRTATAGARRATSFPRRNDAPDRIKRRRSQQSRGCRTSALTKSRCTYLALLWHIISGAGFPNRFLRDSWVVGLWRADHGEHEDGMGRRA